MSISSSRIGSSLCRHPQDLRPQTSISTFTPPSESERRLAIGFSKSGELKHLDQYNPKLTKNEIRELKKILSPDGKHFDPIPEPDEDDWLGWRKAKHQSFRSYVKSKPKKYKPGNQIYLLPLSADGTLDGFPPISVLSEVVENFFGIKTAILDAVPIRKLGKIRTREKYDEEDDEDGWIQYNAMDILDAMGFRKPQDSHTLCAVTMLDIYKGGFNYLFGLARTRGGVGVFSFSRQDPAVRSCEFWNGSSKRGPGDNEKLLRRASATLCHEIGHTFGLKHCTFFRCLMQGSNSLRESEDRGMQLCPVCLRKLHWNTRFSLAKRYANMAHIFEKHHEVFSQAGERIRSRLDITGIQVGDEDVTSRIARLTLKRVAKPFTPRSKFKSRTAKSPKVIAVAPQQAKSNSPKTKSPKEKSQSVGRTYSRSRDRVKSELKSPET